MDSDVRFLLLIQSGRYRREGRMAAKAKLQESLSEAGAKLRSGLEDLKSTGLGDPEQLIIAFDVECLPK